MMSSVTVTLFVKSVEVLPTAYVSFPSSCSDNSSRVSPKDNMGRVNLSIHFGILVEMSSDIPDFGYTGRVRGDRYGRLPES